MSKSVIYIGATVGGLLGGAIGAKFDGGNIFGLWGILLSTIFGLGGIYIAYKIQQ
ncbi:MAG: hypothetical protein WCJ60_02115 [bacterium]